MYKSNITLFLNEASFETYNSNINFDTIFDSDKVQFRFSKADSGSILNNDMFDYNSFFKNKSEMKNQDLIKTNLDSIVTFAEYETIFKFESIVQEKQLSLTEHILYDSYMNKITSVISTNRFSLGISKDLFLFKEFSKALSQEKINICDSSHNAYNFINKVSYTYKITRHFGISNLISCYVGEKNNIQTFLKIMLLLSEKYKVKLNKKDDYLNIFNNLTQYANQNAIINSMMN